MSKQLTLSSIIAIVAMAGVALASTPHDGSSSAMAKGQLAVSVEASAKM